MFVASVSLSVIDPDRDPATVGMKVTDILQLDPPARDPPQLFVSLKSPLARISEKLRGLLPMFVSVSFRAALVVNTPWFPKFKLGGASWTNVPVPVKSSVCGEPGSLSANVTPPVRKPEFVGVNVTLTEQLAPAFSPLAHVFVCAKSPNASMSVKLIAVDAVLVTVTVCFVLVLPTRTVAANETAV